MKYTIVLGIAVLSTMTAVVGCSRKATEPAQEIQVETLQNEASQQNPERAPSDLPVQEEEGQEEEGGAVGIQPQGQTEGGGEDAPGLTLQSQNQEGCPQEQAEGEMCMRRRDGVAGRGVVLYFGRPAVLS